MNESTSSASHTARALVLLHGWALNLRVFDALVAKLNAFDAAPRFEITRLDLPGHGLAIEPPRWRTRADEVGWDIGELAEHLLAQMPPRTALLGWSLGAKVAMEIAARAPQRVAALVLVSATPRFAQADDWPHGTPAERLDALAVALQSDYRRTVSDFLSLQVRGSQDAAASLASLQRALLERGECPPGVLLRALRLLHRLDQRPRLAAIQAPTLVVAGEYDRVVHPQASRALAGLIARARYLELPRCGHAPFLSHEPEFVTAVQSFLAEVGE